MLQQPPLAHIMMVSILALILASSLAAQEAEPPSGGQPTIGEEVPPRNPFRHQIPIPDFPANLTWMNCEGPLTLADLKGKFVLLDFWTYCCINCLHVLPELKKLEHEFAKELVVIGVHSAKFEKEREDDNIKEAILRHEIEHPVVNDRDMVVWRMFGANSWPTILLIDPNGKAVYMRSGEFKFEEIKAVLDAALPYYRHRGVVDESPVRFDLLANKSQAQPLRFPGKVLADEGSNRLFIADSNHNRIVVTDLQGKNPLTIGSGQQGREDGDFQQATFHHPQGMAIVGDLLYVADTENHLIRKIDLQKQQVKTIAGTGVQGRNAWPGWNGDPNERPVNGRWEGVARTTPLNSPWALWPNGEHLYIAMAGPHQIWRMNLKTSLIGPYAGNGREDIVDGARLPATPYGLNSASFAQPSGLSSDGKYLFVADCEGSSIRRVPMNPTDRVTTIVGTAELPANRLFEFGDEDGSFEQAKLQHALGVTYHESKLYIADTYNDKIKTIDLENQSVTTIAGGQGAFNEPAGLSYAAGKLYVADTNNHQIRWIDLNNNNAVTDLSIEVEPPAQMVAPAIPFNGPRFAFGERDIRAGKVMLRLDLPLAENERLHHQLTPQITITPHPGTIQLEPAGPVVVRGNSLELPLTVTGPNSSPIVVKAIYFYCRHANGKNGGLCKIGQVIWEGKLISTASGASQTLEFEATAPAAGNP